MFKKRKSENRRSRVDFVNKKFLFKAVIGPNTIRIYNKTQGMSRHLIWKEFLLLPGKDFLGQKQVILYLFKSNIVSRTCIKSGFCLYKSRLTHLGCFTTKYYFNQMSIHAMSLITSNLDQFRSAKEGQWTKSDIFAL